MLLMIVHVNLTKSCIYKSMYISADRKKNQTTKYFDQIICAIIEKNKKINKRDFSKISLSICYPEA